ncbi:MAG: alpha-glucosidase/alpha-galactosidase, partial [Armatimonadota bacterium]
MARVKIAFIGAGSGSFTLSQVRAICRTPNLHGSLVSLMDIDEDRLRDTHVICQRVAAQLGVDVTFEQTLDRREALSRADFVINTALVDGARRLKEGWLIAEKHGVKWGGSYHILYDEPFWLNYYQLQLFEGIAQDMLEICPDAWLLLISNPVLA